MALGIGKLSQRDGVLKLMEALRLHMFPMATAEARELFKAGQRPGILSKQVDEPFISYISRRGKWHELLKQNGSKPTTLRGEVLDHANLAQSEKLINMTSTFNNFECDRVAEAFVKQHALAHSLKSPDTQHRKAKEKAGQDHAMVLETTGMDGMNPWISTMSQRRTLQLKMNTGKKTAVTIWTLSTPYFGGNPAGIRIQARLNPSSQIDEMPRL